MSHESAGLQSARMPWLGEPTFGTIAVMDLIAAATALVIDRHPEVQRALLTGSVVDGAGASVVLVASKSFVLANRYVPLAEAGLS